MNIKTPTVSNLGTAFLAILVLSISSLVAAEAHAAEFPLPNTQLGTLADLFDGALDGGTYKDKMTSSYQDSSLGTPSDFSGTIQSFIYYDFGGNNVEGGGDDKTHVVWVIEHSAASTSDATLFEIFDQGFGITPHLTPHFASDAGCIGSVTIDSETHTSFDLLTSVSGTNSPPDPVNSFLFRWNAQFEDVPGTPDLGPISPGESEVLFTSYNGLQEWYTFDSTLSGGATSDAVRVMSVGVPEPGTILLTGIGLLGIARRASKKRN